MFFTLFASLVFSEIGSYSIKPISTLLFFSSFGFTNNSNFSFSIHSPSPIKLNMFLLSNYEVHNSVSRYIYKTCISPRIKICNLNKTFNVSMNNFLWNGKVKDKGVYYPLLLLCSENFSTLDVTYNYSNKDTLIDFRSEKNSIVYLSFSSINIFLGLLWLINTYIKNNFSIPLQQIIAFLPLFRSISNALMASEWEMRKYTNNISKIRKFLPVLFSILFYVFFMYSTTLCFSGWCIFRMKLSFIEKAQIFISSFLCVFGFNIDSILSGYVSSLVPILFTTVGFLWYMKLNATYLATLIQLSESDIENIRLKSRIKLVQGFTMTSFSLLILIILIQSGTVSFNFWPIVGTAMQEAGLIFIEIIEICFFFLREKFVGEIDLSYKRKTFPILLIEPLKKDVAFISQEDEEVCSP